ncbi:DUF1382 family protein [Pseudomonas sp.]|uniref:DUF1382 family protein n=1 Tax=Pseudomonas sp. TaxID=306 RepID=UPI0032654C37
MNRASPIDLRKAAEAANTYIKAGVLFVPMPVLSAEDHTELVAQANTRLDQIIRETEEVTP